MCVHIYPDTIGFSFILVVKLSYTIVYKVLFNTNSKLHLLILSFALIGHCFVKETAV